MKLFIVLAIFSLTTVAQEISNNSLLLVHASQYYHLDSKTHDATRELMLRTPGDIIGLYQDYKKIHSLWYVPTNLVDQFTYSITGKHKLYIKDHSSSSHHITISGGYFTHCLARAITSSMANFIEGSHFANKLLISLPSYSIFTGHSILNGQLSPATAYEESILDDTVQGLNLSQVFSELGEFETIKYIREAFPIVFLNHNVMDGLDDFSIRVLYKNKQVITHGYGSKEILISIY